MDFICAPIQAHQYLIDVSDAVELIADERDYFAFQFANFSDLKLRPQFSGQVIQIANSATQIRGERIIHFTLGNHINQILQYPTPQSTEQPALDFNE